MKTKLMDESQLLDEAFRAEVIAEITQSENVNRKQYALRRSEIYRDDTKKWVIERLNRENLKKETIAQMENRAANISICRKIINKLARVYVGGVERTVESKQEQEKISEMARLLDLNQKMKKTDRYRELQKNAIVGVLPEKEWMKPTYCLKTKVFQPWQYDVIEDYYDNEIPRVIVLTDFVERSQQALTSSDGRAPSPIGPDYSQGDGRDQIIADEEADKGKCQRKFIWWCHTYHFTTDETGTIIPELSPEDLLNPIQMLPFISVAEDQDGNYWAKGGEDLIEGSVLVNLLLTDAFSIANYQGWGQLVLKGKDFNKKVEVGPQNALILNQENSDDPEPVAYFISANPPLDFWAKEVEQYVALLLSTNNLSPGNISGKLDASQFPSGIAMLIEQSEFMGEIDDMKSLFNSVERQLWLVIQAWQNLYLSKGLLTDAFKEVGSLNDVDITLRFIDIRPAVSEKEKLENLKQRKDLGLNTELELLKLDNPELDDKAAMAKLLKLKQEKLERMAQMLAQQPAEEGVPANESKEEGSEEAKVEVEDQEELDDANT